MALTGQTHELKEMRWAGLSELIDSFWLGRFASFWWPFGDSRQTHVAKQVLPEVPDGGSMWVS